MHSGGGKSNFENEDSKDENLPETIVDVSSPDILHHHEISMSLHSTFDEVDSEWVYLGKILDNNSLQSSSEIEKIPSDENHSLINFPRMDNHNNDIKDNDHSVSIKEGEKENEEIITIKEKDVVIVPDHMNVSFRFHLDGFKTSKSADWITQYPPDMDELKVSIIHLYGLPRTCLFVIFLGTTFDSKTCELTSDLLIQEIERSGVVNIFIYPTESFVVQLFVNQSEMTTNTTISINNNKIPNTIENDILVEISPSLDIITIYDYLYGIQNSVLGRKDNPLPVNTRVRLLNHENQVEYKNSKSFRNGDCVEIMIENFPTILPFRQETEMEMNISSSSPLFQYTEKENKEKEKNINKTTIVKNSSYPITSSPSYSPRKEIKSNPIIYSMDSPELKFENAIRKALLEIGVQLHSADYTKLRKCSSTVEGAMNYYLNQPEIFSTESSSDGNYHNYDYDNNNNSSSNNNRNQKETDSNHYSIRPIPNSLKHVQSPDIAKQLWDMNFEEQAIIEACKRSGSLEGALNYIFENPGNGNNGDTTGTNNSNINQTKVNRMFQCPICYDDFPIEEMYTSNCYQSHRVCISCTTHFTKLALLGDEETTVHLPACPLAVGSNSCTHLLEQREVTTLLQLSLEKNLISVKEMIAMEKSLKKLYDSKLRRENNFILCVGCPADPNDSDDEAAWFAVDGLHKSERICVTCPRCDSSFCSSCKSLPYHYNCTCDEMIAYARSWREWNVTGKQAFLKELADKSAQYEAILTEYETKKQRHQQEIAAAEARYKELLQDEQHKAMRCKLCPNCNRVIEKVDGCDSMICGRNTHGGDNQSGCGHAFSWTIAKPYQADAGQKRTVNELDVPKPQQAQVVKHMISSEFPLSCDGCKKPIVGPRIKCINCPSTNMCLSCSDKGLQLSNCDHNPSHICTVVWRSELK